MYRSGRGALVASGVRTRFAPAVRRSTHTTAEQYETSGGYKCRSVSKCSGVIE